MLKSRYLTEDDLKDFGFKSLGKNIQISSDARVYGASNISIGSNVRIDDFTILVAVGGRIEIGNYCSIMRSCHLSGTMGIDMRPFSHLAANCVIYSASDDYSGNCLTTSCAPREYLNYLGGKVTIGRHAILGTGCVVLGDATLGDGCGVGAMSLIRSDLEPWGIYAGIPVKKIGQRSTAMLAIEQRLA